MKVETFGKLLIVRISKQGLLIVRINQPRIIDCQDHQLLIIRITKGGKLDDLNMAPDSSPFIDSVTRQDSFDGEDDEPGVEGMEVVGKAVEVATPLGTRYM